MRLIKVKLNKENKIKLKNNNMNLEIAKLCEIDEIYNLYESRINWFKLKNINQWNTYLLEHPKEEFILLIKKFKLFVLKHQERIISSFCLLDTHELWNDEKDAFYICRVVVKPGYKKIGDYIFDICKDIALNNNKEYLRLNHIKKNKKLNEIYEKYGFKIYKENQTYFLREKRVK